MKMKKYSRKAAVLAVGIICCTIMTFTASAQDTSERANSMSKGTQADADGASKEDDSMPEGMQADETDGISKEDDRMPEGMQADAADGISKEGNSMPEGTQANVTDGASKEGNSMPDESGQSKAYAKAGEAKDTDKSAVSEEIAQPDRADADEAAEKVNSAADDALWNDALGNPASRASKGESMKAAAGTNRDVCIKMDADVVRKQIAELAGKYVGAPYRSGGTDLSSGVDSAGFVKAVYARAGYDVPADLHKLPGCGNIVPLEELSAGDIIIYSSGDGDSTKNLYAHAGIYDGSGQVIHASNARDGVKISDLNYREIALAVRIIL